MPPDPAADAVLPGGSGPARAKKRAPRGDPDAVSVRPAATVMLVRDAPAAAPGPDSAPGAAPGAAPGIDPATGPSDSVLQVLMVRRNLQSDFVGGAYVFPGGAVDPIDGGAEAETICRGRTDVEASILLGIEEGGLAYWVAALRETFEEAGLLLAERPDGPPLLAGDAEEEARFVAERLRVNQGSRRFLDLCREEKLQLQVADVHYFAHWITPRGAPRRYDTRFFVAAAPPGQQAAHDAGETIADTWITPRQALEGHRRGVFELIFPTIRNLQAISRFATSAELLAAAGRASGSVPTIEPRVISDGNGVRIVLPGDEGYDDGSANEVSGESGDFNEAIRAVSRAANADDGVTEGGAAAPAP